MSPPRTDQPDDGWAGVDVLLGIGWLTPSHVGLWRQGRLHSLEREVQVNLNELTEAMRLSVSGPGHPV